MKIRVGVEVWLLKNADNQSIQTLLLRKKNGKYEPFWQPPTGGTEFGESQEAAAVREVREETGLQIVENQLVILQNGQQIWLEKLDTLWVATVYFAWLDGSDFEVKISAEHDAFGWFSMEETAEKLFWEGNKTNFELLKKAISE